MCRQFGARRGMTKCSNLIGQQQEALFNSTSRFTSEGEKEPMGAGPRMPTEQTVRVENFIQIHRVAKIDRCRKTLLPDTSESTSPINKQRFPTLSADRQWVAGTPRYELYRKDLSSGNRRKTAEKKAVCQIWRFIDFGGWWWVLLRDRWVTSWNGLFNVVKRMGQFDGCVMLGIDMSDATTTASYRSSSRHSNDTTDT